MRIDPNTKVSGPQNSEQIDKAGSRITSAALQRELLGEDQAHFSPDQARVRGLAAEANRLPEIRQERVAALASAVRNGTYNVTPEKTASAILDHITQGFAA